jgi:hypothetical protein
MTDLHVRIRDVRGSANPAVIETFALDGARLRIRTRLKSALGQRVEKT